MEISSDSIHKLDNSFKSTNGNALNKYVEQILIEYALLGYIKKFIKEPKYRMPGFEQTQFNPDFEITLLDGSIIVIDNTTTIRSDRMKQKQWDSFGVKAYFESIGETILSYVVIPNKEDLGSEDTNSTEIKMYLNYRENLLSGRIYSAIDDVLQISELLDQIKFAI